MMPHIKRAELFAHLQGRKMYSPPFISQSLHFSPIPDVTTEILRQTDYDKMNASMIRFAIQSIASMMKEELSNQPQIPVENNTIVVFGIVQPFKLD